MCPQNAHSMPDADAEGSFGDPSCGDYLTIYIKVKDNHIDNINCNVQYDIGDGKRKRPG